MAMGSKSYLCGKNKMRFCNMHSLLMNLVKVPHKKAWHTCFEKLNKDANWQMIYFRVRLLLAPLYSLLCFVTNEICLNQGSLKYWCFIVVYIHPSYPLGFVQGCPRWYTIPWIYTIPLDLQRSTDVICFLSWHDWFFHKCSVSFFYFTQSSHPRSVQGSWRYYQNVVNVLMSPRVTRWSYLFLILAW